MNRIAILFTGGTISSRSGATIALSPIGPRMLLAYAREAYPNIWFEAEEPLSQLSENLHPDDWIILYNAIRSMDLTNLDGIIVAHGTDTLAYTACALSFLLCDLNIPLLIVSSHFPLDNPRTNGQHNLRAAVDFMMKTHLPGVYVPIHLNGKTDIHLGSRLTQPVPFIHSFASAGGQVFGQMTDGFFTPTAGHNPSTAELCTARPSILGDYPKFSTDILLLSPYPGLDYSRVDLEHNPPRAVLHGLYHSATACTRPRPTKGDAAEFVRRALAANVDVWLAPAAKGETRYESFAPLLAAGAIPLVGISLEAALVKLMLTYGCFANDRVKREAFLASNLFFEKIESIS